MDNSASWLHNLKSSVGDPDEHFHLGSGSALRLGTRIRGFYLKHFIAQKTDLRRLSMLHYGMWCAFSGLYRFRGSKLDV